MQLDGEYSCHLIASVQHLWRNLTHLLLLRMVSSGRVGVVPVLRIPVVSAPGTPFLWVLPKSIEPLSLVNHSGVWQFGKIPK
jgi:hypothetical protein